MTQMQIDKYPSFFYRLKFFLALSRTPHGLIDMATPVFAALIWIGHIPSFTVVFLGLLTTFAGYTAVYALNDIVDYRQDRLAARQSGTCPAANGDLDAILVRHPMACGFLSFREGLAWTVFWAALAVIGAYLLNPDMPVDICSRMCAGNHILPAVAGQPLPHPCQWGRQNPGSGGRDICS